MNNTARQPNIDHYGQAVDLVNKTFLELREMTNDGSIDLLRKFSETCRAELESLRAQV